MVNRRPVTQALETKQFDILRIMILAMQDNQLLQTSGDVELSSYNLAQVSAQYTGPPE